MELETWFEHLWNDYAAIAPRVSSIRGLLEQRGELIVDDHVAFRTLNVPSIGLEALGAVIEGLGYQRFDDYRFPEKKLRARSYIHDDDWPRVFLSELLVEELPPEHQAILGALADQINPAFSPEPASFWAGTLWEPIAFEDYLVLQEHSEYAAWFAALGLRPNHFTVNLNSLDSFRGLDALLDFVVDAGFPLNESGGRIKGSPQVFLEQGSTLADRLAVKFAGGEEHEIPTCYYEFALRHPVEGGIYEGFVAASADRIFESTHAKA